jgi:integrase
LRAAPCGLWRTIGSPKSTAGDREIPMAPIVVNTLCEWWLACPEGEAGLVFPNGASMPSGARPGIVDAGGKPKYGLHALRHFCASWLIEQSFSAKRVQALLGYSSIQMTFDRFGHLFPSLEDDHAKSAAGELAVVGC